MKRLLIGLDVGTGTIKALALNPETGKAEAIICLPTPVLHLQYNTSEHDSEALWQVAATCLREVTRQIEGASIAGIAISCFGDTGLPLDEADQPIYPIIAWYDRRCSAQVDWLKTQISPQDLQEITGQRFSTSLDAPKWLWIRTNIPRAAARTAYWMPVASFLFWKLTGEKFVDYSIASRTSLLNQNTLEWSNEMLDLVSLTADQLPKLLSAGSPVGKILPQAAELTGIRAGTPCALGGHDHLCASLVTGAERSTTLVDSNGTAESLLVVLPHFMYSPEMFSGGYTCYAHVLKDQYVLRGGLRSAGGSLQWLAQLFTDPEKLRGDLPYSSLARLAEQGIGKRIGPIWLPHLMGSGTPENDPNSLGAMVGLTSDHNQGDIFRGMLESLAFWLRQNRGEMEKLVGNRFDEIILLGGTTRLPLLTQLKADVLNQPVILADISESAAVGAALLAGVGSGLFADLAQAARCLNYQKITIEPDVERAEWYQHLYETAYLPLYKALAEIHHNLIRITDPSAKTN